MYGRGNYAPQFGQGLQRPMPPYQQQLAGHPSATHFQPGTSVPMQPIIQQGDHPHGPTPRGPSYLHAPPASQNMPHQRPPTSTSYTSQTYHHPPPPFLEAQHSFVPGSQNPQPSRQPPPSVGHRAPLPPPFMQLPPPPPPPTAGGFLPPESGKQQTAETETPATAPQPPPLPPPSPPMAPPPPSSRPWTQSRHGPVSEHILLPNNATQSHKNGNTPIPDEDMSLKQSVLVGLPPPPPKPADENVVRNIEVLCQFIAKNGPEFEDMARKKESGNPMFNFLVGGDPGSEAASAQEYFLWMKNKCTVENGLHKDQEQRDLSQRGVDEPLKGPNFLPNVGTTHSLADSDVDMEDDITQSDKDHGANNSTGDPEQEPILAGDASEMHKQENENEVQHLKDSNSALKSSQSDKLEAGAESKPENSAGDPNNVHSPFRLIQNYASDDSSEDDGEQCPDNVKATVVSPIGTSGASSSRDATEYSINKYELGLGKSVTTCSESGLTKDQDDLQANQGDLQEAPDNALQGNNEIDGLDGRTERFNANAAFHGKYVSESSCAAVTHKDVEKQDEKNSRSAVKVDEFGRLVKEGANESESDDSWHLRRRGRRDRSRSRSRSPSDRRRRRSPRRRKERRSRSRSWSPKRHRIRSRSPYKLGGDFRGEKLRRGKVQTQVCFDFLKGRCYRGASCRYLHQEVDKDENPKRYNGKGHLEADKCDSRDVVTQTCDERIIAEAIDDDAQPSVSHQDVENMASDVKIVVDSEKGFQDSGASDEPIFHLPISEDQQSSGMPSINEQVMNHPEAEGSVGAYNRVDEDLLKKENSAQIDSSTVQTSAISPSGLSANEPGLNKILTEFTTPNACVRDISLQVSHFPPPPLPQQALNAPHPNLLVDYNYMAPSGSLPPQSVPVESVPLYHAPLPNQQSHYPLLPNPAWSALPQPRSPHVAGPSMPGSNLARDDRYPQVPTQSTVSSSSFVPGVIPQPVPFQRDSTVISTQSVAGDTVLVGESPNLFFQNHQFVQKRLPPYGPQLTSSESMLNHGGSLSVPGYSSNLGDRDNSSSLFDVGGTRISAHYNPYASTFDQPLSTRFSSIAFAQGKEAATGVQCDNTFGVGSALMDGRLSSDPTSRQIISSSNSPKAGGQTVPKSGGDQYDPLFDSIDPKLAQKQDHAADNSDIMLKLSNRQKVLYVEENNKRKMVGAVAASASPENDEFGETADAEVGAVENGSPSDPNEDADIAKGDIEIDQVKPKGRSKKSKDSKSMKLFKIAVANFVKDVLKPQWRLGNMSKEVFKTIVKKTVDKVSGAMKNHRVPKSQAKIDHYIDSSRRKLTQLVEGYVSKYNS